jgi:hypothetical protein
MMNMKKIALTLMVATIAFAGVANAADIHKSGKITTSETWTADNKYILDDQVVFDGGATLTIEAGTLITGGNANGSLAIAAGSKIYVNGTKDNPVIMTADNDDFENWQAQSEQWGNLTIMGDALISASHVTGNNRRPDGTNTVTMEGLTPVSGETWHVYGGGDDDDDSGSISYLSLRYGGKVTGQDTELNGMSLGGVGRETNIDHVEIMNNIDDGIEIWGGTVNLKYVVVWNIGDDSFDLDQGWRGKAQFGLIVQGYSKVTGDSGSGVADRCFEMDGAENSDAQPVTTAAIYNFTVIGQLDGDDAMNFRDNARVQLRNCLFLETGDKLVAHGDAGGGGWGVNGTLPWASAWTTDANDVTKATQGFEMGGVAYSTMYKSQDPNGKLCEVSDSVFWNIGDFGEAVSVGVVEDTTAGNKSNDNVIAYATVGDPLANSPIMYLERGDEVTTGGGETMQLVVKLDPRAANAAVSSADGAPADGFYTPVRYRGAFSPTHNWMLGWTAADQYGMLVDVPNNDETPEPSTDIAKIQMNTTFDTEADVYYTVEKSSDLKSWSPVATVKGDGNPMTVEDLDNFESGKFYRVVRQ